MSDSRTSWFKRGKKTLTDNEIFENLTRVIFQGGLTWDLIQRKWPNFQEAFANFDVQAVAKFTDDDLARLLEDASIIRNSQKIEGSIHNAREIVKIQAEYGSFAKYLASLDKSGNYVKVIKELSKRFKRLGKKSTYIFLYSIGEDITWDLPE